MTAPVIVWLRRDLRLADQPAMAAAVATGAPVLPVYVLDDESPGDRRIGGAQRWWLHYSLAALGADLAARGSRLILRRGRASEVLRALLAETGAATIHAIAHHERWWLEEEAALGSALVLHHGNYLAPVGSVRSGSGEGYRIFTPFFRALTQRVETPDPMPAPATLPAPDVWPASERLEEWDLLPTKPDWATGFAPAWTPGETGAAAAFEAFFDKVSAYGTTRNLPSRDGTSALSPHLHHGEIAVGRIWAAVADAGAGEGGATFQSELGWRDFAQNLILTYPDYERTNAREAFDNFPWRDPSDSAVAADLAAWQRGQTGYPIVDAGMRQLWTIGWMHNRVRMLTASFLIKHLLIDWRHGERWFWDTLLCADQASNSVNWQWVAGSGVDSSMFSRIMAPIGQSEKFAAGDYIRRWVPELANVPDPAIHDPDARTRARTGYRSMIIGHAEARERALTAYARMRATSVAAAS